jgi:hypothetical protein
LQLVFGHDARVAHWVAEQLGLVILPPYVAIGGTRDGRTLCAGAVFNQWNGSNLEITLYGPGCLNRGAIRAIYHYAFMQVGARRLSATTRRSNKRMQRMLPRLGFEFEGVGKRFFGPRREDDAMRFVLLPERAGRWMEVRHSSGS